MNEPSGGSSPAADGIVRQDAAHMPAAGGYQHVVSDAVPGSVVMNSVAAISRWGTLADHGFVCLKSTLPSTFQNGNKFQASGFSTVCHCVRSRLALLAVGALFCCAAPAATRSNHQEERGGQVRRPDQDLPLSLWVRGRLCILSAPKVVASVLMAGRIEKARRLDAGLLGVNWRLVESWSRPVTPV
jgi:hypothetical protein